MKTYKIFAGLASLAVLGVISACSKDEPDPNKRVFPERTFAPTAFDNWLHENYIKKYNVDYRYRFEEIEADRTKSLTPARLDKSMKLAKVIQHAWFGAYDEVAGEHFMATHAPRVLSIVGSPSLNGDGSQTLGTAEGGMRVTLYKVNNLELTTPEALNASYFHTMHHEFAHIIHQKKDWPTDFNLISRGDYLASGFFNTDVAVMSKYAPKGFVSAYARSQEGEDIAEVTAAYITWTQAEWNTLYQAAGTEGSARIRRKVEIVKNYMQTEWNIDMDQLRDRAYARGAEIIAQDATLIEDDWQALLPDPLRSLSASSLSARRIEAERELMREILLKNPDLLDKKKHPELGGGRCQVITQYFHNH